MAPDLLKGASIVGIGQTEFSKSSGRSELQLAVEAIGAALDDAGLTTADVDGLVTYSIDSNDQITVGRNLGVPELRFFASSLFGGGGACATVHLAAMAVATGAASTVVIYRALNERSGLRFGQAMEGMLSSPFAAMYAPYGLMTPAQFAAVTARRYMHAYGVDNEHFGLITVASRKHAATNPAAYFYERPITLEEHQQSRWVVEPVLRLLDCCQESDGAVAVVITTGERARDLRHRPVIVEAAAHGAGAGAEMMTSYYRGSLTDLPDSAVVAGKLWEDSGLRPADVDVAIFYDHFTPLVLMQFEEFGFCDRGEAKDFVAGGTIEVGGRLPLNPHGGHLGEAYIHGLNGVAEAVRQLRRTAVNQVDEVEHVLVTAGSGLPTSGALLGRG